MKIVIIGYSGSGKSFLARRLGACTGATVLHLDAVHWLPGWKERPDEEAEALVASFLDAHDDWVIDGNYTRLCYERRLEEADRIVLLLFGRFACLCRAWRRFRRYAGQSRPDMADGCAEKFDAAFVRWILRDGRTKRTQARYASIAARFPHKAVVLRRQRELDAFAAQIEKECNFAEKGRNFS